MQGLLDFLLGVGFETVADEHLNQLLLIFGLADEAEKAYRHLFDAGWMFYDGPEEWRRDNVAGVLEGFNLSVRLVGRAEVPPPPARAPRRSTTRGGEDEDEYRLH